MLPQMDFTPIPHIEIRNGQARIAGRNVKVKMVISRLIHGEPTTIEDVMEQYNLSRAEVHAVLAYYYDHKEMVDRFFEEEDRIAREHIPSIETLHTRLQDSMKDSN